MKIRSGRTAILVGLLLVVISSMGCEPLHRDLEPVWEADVGDGIDTGGQADADGECEAGGECGPCGLGEFVCNDGVRVCQGSVDLSTDSNHCGSCNQACDPGFECQDGQCEGPEVCEPGAPCGPCDQGVFICDANDDPVCEGAVDLDTDDNNCGICGNVCTAPTSCEAGSCSLEENAELSSVSCPGRVDLMWSSISGADRYEVQWGSSESGPWTGGGISAVEGDSGLEVDGNRGVNLHFEQNVDQYFFRVVGYSGTQAVGQTNPLEISVAQSDVGSVTDTADELIVPEGAIYSTSGTIEKDLTIEIQGTLCVESHEAGSTGSVRLVAPSVEIGASGAISATAAGHEGGGFGCSGGQPGAAGGGGASYGGSGSHICSDAGGGVYGSATERTIEMGSGGGGVGGGAGEGGGGEACGFRSMSGGRGGGAISLVSSVELLVAGSLLANGSGAFGNCEQIGGAGSGGGILLEGEGISIDDTATILARGGGLGQPGGGGRIKVFDGPSISGDALIDAASGGSGAQAGTIHLPDEL